jgi:tripartite-type tricarboxylate transporter receptor subunit TctC
MRPLWLAVAAPAAMVVALAAMAGVAIAQAPAYPTRPITILVPFPAGGPVDTLARILSEPMRASLGQPLIVENVSGAGGSIGIGRLARAAPDGYTLASATGRARSARQPSIPSPTTSSAISSRYR